jgi:hypothetical protein
MSHGVLACSVQIRVGKRNAIMNTRENVKMTSEQNAAICRELSDAELEVATGGIDYYDPPSACRSNGYHTFCPPGGFGGQIIRSNGYNSWAFPAPATLRRR